MYKCQAALVGVAGAGHQCCFELAMKPFYQFIGTGVVGCGPHTMDAQEGHELGPQTRLKLAAMVRYNCDENPKMGYPPRQKGVGDCFCGDLNEGNGFRPTGEPIHTHEQVGVALRGRV